MFKKITFSSERKQAQKMAEMVRHDIPINLLDKRGKVLSVNKVTHQLEMVFEEARKFQREENIGFLGKSFLAHEFKWSLVGFGYSDEFVSTATEGLVRALAKR